MGFNPVELVSCKVEIWDMEGRMPEVGIFSRGLNNCREKCERAWNDSIKPTLRGLASLRLASAPESWRKSVNYNP